MSISINIKPTVYIMNTKYLVANSSNQSQSTRTRAWGSRIDPWSRPARMVNHDIDLMTVGGRRMDEVRPWRPAMER